MYICHLNCINQNTLLSLVYISSESLKVCSLSTLMSYTFVSFLYCVVMSGFTEFTSKEIVNKMNKLRQKYKLVKDKARKTGGNENRKKWKFCDQMNRFLSHRQNITPLKY